METKVEKHIMRLDDLIANASDAELAEALIDAQDALSFAQSLWNLFADQCLHDDGPNPDYTKMEQIIDALNGELAAAVLLLNSLDGNAEQLLLRNADLLDKYRKEDPAASEVPQVVIAGNRRLAERVKNTKIILAAKNSIPVITKKR